MNVLQLLRKMHFIPFRKRLEYYPPFFFMRVKVLSMSDDMGVIVIKLPLTMLSKNAGDTMFGGYMAALADPIAALACAQRFPGYSVWTRAMHIDFLRQGKTDLQLRFTFDHALHQQITQELADKGRCTPSFEYGFYLEDGSLCASVLNTVAIRPSGYGQSSNKEY
ncbi:MAG: PaaI family thioesterase [Gammaproteobacteria bacterium]|nr:PaaI family thioesterase [Gammaproteobacteria bacterium]